MRILALPLALFTALVLSACADPQNDARSADPATTTSESATTTTPGSAKPCDILMGWDPWEPYQYQDVDGQMRGLDVELVNAIADTAGCKVEFVEGRWGTLVRQLQKGEVDMLTGATRTPSRETFAHFSAPYRGEVFTLYVRKNDIDKYDYANLPALLDTGFRVGVTEQYIYGDTVSALQENPKYAEKFVGATIGELNYARLLDFEIDGFLEDPFVAARTFRARGLDAQIAPHPIEIHSGDVNLMFSQISVTSDIVTRIDDAIYKVNTDGRYKAIIDKYLD